MPDRRLLRILPGSFLASLAIGTINLGMLFLIKGVYGAGPALVGWFTALLAAAYFAGCVIFRPLSSRIDASTSAVLMCFISAALLGLQLALHSLAAAFAAFTLYGLATALLWPRLMGWLSTGVEGEALSRVSGAFSLSWSTGLTFAPYIAGLLAESSPSLPIYAGIGILAATGTFLIVTRSLAPAPRPIRKGPDPAPGAPREAATTIAKDLSTRLRYPAWIGLFSVYVLQSVLTNIFPLFAKDELVLSESRIGLFLLLRAAALAAGFVIFSRLSFWRFKPLYLPLSLGAILLLDIAFIFARSLPALALFLALLGLVQAFVYSLSIFYGASGAIDRDRRMSIHEAVLTVGQILGSVAGGGVYQGSSWPRVFILAAALSLLFIPLQLCLSRKR